MKLQVKIRDDLLLNSFIWSTHCTFCVMKFSFYVICTVFQNSQVQDCFIISLYFLCNEIFLLCDLHSFSELTSSRLFYNFLEFIIQQIFFSLIATFLIKAWAADAIFSDYSFTEWQLRFTNVSFKPLSD